MDGGYRVANKNVEMITISDYIVKYQEDFSVISMGTSSWGEGGQFQVWKNPEQGWIWPYINGAIKEFENILDIIPNPNEWEQRVLKQIARELLLMEVSV